MDAIKNLLSRNSINKLVSPHPTPSEMDIIYQAALRAPDHANLKPSYFIEITGSGLEKLSNTFIKYAKENIDNLGPEKIKKYKNAPHRAPMIIVIISNIIKHEKVPEIEQILSTSAATQNMLLALHAMNYGAIWRTGIFALNDKIGNYLGIKNNQHILGYLYVGTPAKKPKAIPEIDINKYITKWN